MPTWIQHPITGKLIPKNEYNRSVEIAPYVQGDIEGFISPIDKTVIDDRGKLRRHNEKHGVTDSRDYSDEFMKERSVKRLREMQGRTPDAKRERLAILKAQLDRLGIR